MQANDCSPSRASLPLNLTWYAFHIKPESIVKLTIIQQHYFKPSAPPNIPAYSQQEAANYFKTSGLFAALPGPPAAPEVVSGIFNSEAVTRKFGDQMREKCSRVYLSH
jgi:hypothetical protein